MSPRVLAGEDVHRLLVFVARFNSAGDRLPAGPIACCFVHTLHKGR